MKKERPPPLSGPWRSAGITLVVGLGHWFSFSHLQRSTQGTELVAP